MAVRMRGERGDEEQPPAEEDEVGGPSRIRPTGRKVGRGGLAAPTYPPNGGAAAMRKRR